jgi:anti-sigma regulatory factor (Ser/Thr protein kinase)
VLSPGLVLRLPASMASVASARRAVERLAFVSDELRDDVKILVTELLTNAVRHSRSAEDSSLIVRIGGSPDRVLIEVIDPGPCFEARDVSAEPGLTERGMGLRIVSRLAHRWGSEPEPGACRTWAEVLAG